MNYFNYFTETEEHFVRRRGKHLFVSPLDWSLIETWKEAGIPLHVVIRGIDIAMDHFNAKKRSISSRPGTLLYCLESVMEEYARWLESHVGEAAGEPTPALHKDPAEAAGPDSAAIEKFLEERISEITTLSGKLSTQTTVAEAATRVTERLSALAADVATGVPPELESLERDLGILDELLVGVLRGCVPEGMAAEWEAEAKKELKVYRKRLPKETYQKILDNYMKTRVRKLFAVGELSLFHL